MTENLKSTIALLGKVIAFENEKSNQGKSYSIANDSSEKVYLKKADELGLITSAVNMCGTRVTSITQEGYQLNAIVTTPKFIEEAERLAKELDTELDYFVLMFIKDKVLKNVLDSIA
jgi:hypothetical protein